MGQAGRAHVASHFSAEAVARQMEQVYERVLAGRR
jgi:glycosyltransferase involved in cell wall biosynthesis